MSKFDEKVQFYKDHMKSLGISYDEKKFVACVKACGPSIYISDAETVSSSDSKELETVKKNYLMNKLGLTERDNLDGVIEYAVDKMGQSNRNKYRAIFYYLCSQKSGKYPS